MLLYYYLFLVFQMTHFPEYASVIQRELLRKYLNFLVYGDDQALSFLRCRKIEHVVGMRAFTSFMSLHFNVVFRDIETSLLFHSEARNGVLVRKGVCFLRHYYIINPDRGDNQPYFLPFRETREFLVRVMFGREPVVRDCFDVLLSIMEHVYGTYGSNEVAYLYLKTIYYNILHSFNLKHDQVPVLIIARADLDTLKRFRQVNVTTENLLEGFPTMESLKLKNRFQASKHGKRHPKIDTIESRYQEEYGF